MRFRTIRRVAPFIMLLTVAAALAQGQSSGVGGPVKGFSARPAWTAPLSASLADDCLQLFKDKNFAGSMVQVSDVTTKTPWQDHEFAGKSENKFSSIRWSLPRGVVVSMFENDDGLGRMIALWGSGEIESLNKSKLNDKLSCWMWSYIGGAKEPAQRIVDGRARRPKYAKEIDTGTLAANSIHLFRNREAKGKEVAIQRITDDQPADEFREMPGEIGKGTSSLKWRLPEGVIVVFSEEKTGEGRQLAIWGDGLFEACSQWDMNDRITHWAWYDVGDQ